MHRGYEHATRNTRRDDRDEAEPILRCDASLRRECHPYARATNTNTQGIQATKGVGEQVR